MARKNSLRDFQAYLAGRLSDAAQGQAGTSWLGIEIGGEGWLIDLADRILASWRGYTDADATAVAMLATVVSTS